MVMFESIINTVFSIPYLLTGFIIAIILDLIIYRSKTSSRLTLLEIWGCAMCWSLIILMFLVAYTSTIKNSKRD